MYPSEISNSQTETAELRHLRKALTNIRTTLSPNSPREAINHAIAALADLRTQMKVWDRHPGTPVSPAGDLHDYPSATASAVIELLDWSLDVFAVTGEITDQLEAWDEVITEKFETWRLQERITKTLGREPYPQELDAISTAMAEGKLTFAEAITLYAA